MKAYRFLPGSTLAKVLTALAAAEPLTVAQLREAIEHTGTRGNFMNAMSRPLALDVVRYDSGKYSRGDMPVRARERRLSTSPLDSWRGHLPEPSALTGSLRTLMDCGSAVPTGDPLRAIADMMDAARAVLTAPRSRFKGAEVELLVAREIRSVTLAAQLATTTLQQALEVLQ